MSEITYSCFAPKFLISLQYSCFAPSSYFASSPSCFAPSPYFASSPTILLVNPFGEKHIRLPALNQYYKSEIESGTVRKVVFSANPTWNNDYVVMAIYGAYSRFAFYISSDKAWTKVGNQDFFDIIDRYGCVSALSNISTSPVLECVAHKRIARVVPIQLYLVDLSGDLLLVQREADESNNTTGFQVFKMDLTEQVFTKVEDIGDRVLFVGSISSISVLTSHFFGCHHSNRIYFDRNYNSPILNLSPWDMGYCCLNDGYVRQICTPKTGHVYIWIEPQVATSLK